MLKGLLGSWGGWVYRRVGERVSKCEHVKVLRIENWGSQGIWGAVSHGE
jgi:hypothetical protein